MKKIILFFVLIFFISFIYSEELTIQTNSMFSFSEPVSSHQKAQTSDELKQMMSENENKMNEELNELKTKEKIVYENQNQVRQAVYSFLSMEYLMPSVGIIVSDIARQINTSVEKTIQAEEKIQSRWKISYFLFGGDFNSAEKIESELILNQERISNLEELNLRCGCSSEVQDIFGEQIQNIEEEQFRLQEIVILEKSSKGLIGWIWK